MSNLQLHAVHSVTRTSDPDALSLTVDITDAKGESRTVEFCYRPSDQAGLSPLVGEWLAGNPDFPIQPYVPPTIEETRVTMPSLTARQLRLGLVNGGFSLAQVSAVIDAMPDGPEKETAEIEWEYATTFNRMHPLIAIVGGALGLSDEQIDAMWMAAADL